MIRVSKEAKAYTTIDSKAGSNMAMQGISAVLGFPFTLIVDAGVIFTHYGPMINEIRRIYGRGALDKESIKPILSGCRNEIMADILVDKIIGQIPIVGIAANIMCAKAMTWRLGLMVAMISANGEEITTENVKKTCILIRELFPQKNTFKFKKPSVVIVERLLKSTECCSEDIYEEKINMMLNALEA